jgi:hypothetical protein
LIAGGASKLCNARFDCRWCIKALAATRDNTDVAADWILTNQEKLEAEAAAADARAAEEAKRKQMEEESSFFLNLAGAGGAMGGTCIAPKGATSGVCLLGLSARSACTLCRRESMPAAAAVVVVCVVCVSRGRLCCNAP